MDIISSVYSIAQLSLALGFFDGVHYAHQKVISAAVNYAQEHNTKSAVVTFNKHPFCVLKNIEPKYITSRKDCYDLIGSLGIDYIIELDFNEISGLSARDYLENILIKYYSPKAIFTGFNHCFGANRKGNTEYLYICQKLFGFDYYPIDAQLYENKVISSSAIRTAIKSGQIELANAMLGREFSVGGMIIQGKQLGRTIGFPTINISYPCEIVEPLFGVYQVRVLIDGKNYKGIANFGIRPTVSDKQDMLLEVHILDFCGDLYGKKAKVFFQKMIRTEKKFSDIEKLKQQIQIDISHIN